MSDEENQNNENRTPLEETFDLPSLDEINNEVTNEYEDNDSSENDDEEYDEFDYNQFENLTEDEISNVQERLKKTKKELQEIKDIDYQNRQIKEYDKDVKDIHNKAIDRFEELMSTAVNMEASQGSKYLNAATKLLDIALNAKNSSFDKHMEMAKLQFQKEKEDNKKNPKDVKSHPYNEDHRYSTEDEDDGGEVVGSFDRNKLLSDISEKYDYEGEDDSESEEDSNNK